jgi:hypothetical protein
LRRRNELIVVEAQTLTMPIGVFFARKEAGDDRLGRAGIEIWRYANW